LDRIVVAARLGLRGLLLVMVALNVGNAIGRYVFLRSIEGADEILVFALVWLVFLGAALVTWEGGHLSPDLLDRMLARRARAWLGRVQLLTTAVLTVFVAVQSASFVERIGRIGQVSIGAGIPMVIPHLAIPTPSARWNRESHASADTNSRRVPCRRAGADGRRRSPP
jgi:TRAP-type C4-dicarboxylate transport system permease small subunit